MREELRRLLLEDVECGRRDCSTCQYNYSDDACFEHLSGLIADHLIENGVILPPCKVGDRVYSINIGDEKSLKIWIEPNGDRITQIKINRGGYHFKCWWGYFHLSDIGKTVFLTKEEAELALKEHENNGC